jgi:predicted alpha/beta hydrolase
MRAPYTYTVEDIELAGTSGLRLAARVLRPEVVRGAIVATHAMFGRKESYFRPKTAGLAELLAGRGYLVVTYDLRGHGSSPCYPAARQKSNYRAQLNWTYQDLVREDLPLVFDYAKSQVAKLPVLLVGHSLGGHMSIAAQASGTVRADGLLVCGANIWIEADEPQLRGRIAKQVAIRAGELITQAFGYFPARMLRFGSDNESALYMQQMLATYRRKAWTSDDGSDDYLALMGEAKAPLASIASVNDPIFCRLGASKRFLARWGGPLRQEELFTADDGSAAPNHKEMLTTSKARAAFLRQLDWLEAQCGTDAGGAA